MPYIWQLSDETVDVGLLGSLLNFFNGDHAIKVTVGNVVGNAGVKQDWFLLYNAHLFTQPGELERGDVATIQHLLINNTQFIVRIKKTEDLLEPLFLLKVLTNKFHILIFKKQTCSISTPAYSIWDTTSTG